LHSGRNISAVRFLNVLLSAAKIEFALLTISQMCLSKDSSSSIKTPMSYRMEDTSGIPQGSALGPILFVFYINDLPDVVESEVYLFADDTNIFRLINSIDDQQILQNDLIKLENWRSSIRFDISPSIDTR
jgi:hypothetical protein